MSPDKATTVVEKNGTIYVAEKKNLNLIMGLLLILAGMFLLIGIASLSTIMALIQSYIMIFLGSLTGWEPIMANLFVGAIALFIATLLYVVVRRESDVAQKIEHALRMNISNEPTEYYALDTIPTEELLNEFKHRGCTIVKREGNGLDILCKEIPHSRRIIGVIDPSPFTLSRMQQYSVIIVIFVLWSVYLGTLLYQILVGDMIWIVAMALLLLSGLFLMCSNIIQLWHTIILWTTVNIVFSFFFAADPVVVWSFWGAEAIYVIIVAIAYLIYQGQCEGDDKWYCSALVK